MMSDTTDLITTVAACRVAGGDESPVNPSTLWRWVKAGRISPPIKVGPGTARFSKRKLLNELGIEAAA
jgi:predicted site-specific integrase-resolvase